VKHPKRTLQRGEEVNVAPAPPPPPPPSRTRRSA